MWTELGASVAGPGAGFLYAIGAVAAYALAVVLERTYWLQLRWRPDLDAAFAAIAAGDAEGALGAAGDTPVGDVLAAGLAEDDVDLAWDAMTIAAVEAEDAVHARIPSLLTAANVATMLGLLGTVYGLMIGFSALEDTATASRAVRLSAGISTALSSTAAGLVVGIAATAAHAAVEARARAIGTELEATAGRVALHLRRDRR